MPQCRALPAFLLLTALLANVAVLDWGYASRRAKRGQSAAMMAHYDRLGNLLGDVGLFCYDYAIESLYAGQQSLAYTWAEACSGCLVNYDLTMLRGDICRNICKQGGTASEANYAQEALKHYREAAFMCPVRFAPLYGQWKIHMQTGDTVQADSIARIMMRKTIKVNSAAVQRMLREVAGKRESTAHKQENTAQPPFFCIILGKVVSLTHIDTSCSCAIIDCLITLQQFPNFSIMDTSALYSTDYQSGFQDGVNMV